MSAGSTGDERPQTAVTRGVFRARTLLASAALLALLTTAAPAAARPWADPATAAGQPQIKAPNDPWEWLNRRFYKIHRAIDRAILRPAAIAYETVTPKFIRSGVHNFLSNLGEPVVFANDVLQLRMARGARTLGRFAANTTVGVGGLFDPATATGLPHHDNSFGTTLARYGVPSGPYLFLPLFGPSTVRDLIGAGVEFASDPLSFTRYHQLAAFNATTFVVGGLDQRASAESDLQEIDQMGTDSYATLRSLYLQNREAEISDRPIDIQNLPDFDEPATAATTPQTPAAVAAAGPSADPASTPSNADAPAATAETIAVASAASPPALVVGPSAPEAAEAAAPVPPTPPADPAPGQVHP